MNKIESLLQLISENHGINDKDKLCRLVVDHFRLTQDGKVFYCDEFAIRFSKSSGPRFSNTVLSLSSLKKVDHIPFIVCAVTPNKNYLLLANSTLIKKASHSSQELRVDNIKGSFNGSDISRDLNGITNEPNNIQRLFEIHREIGFTENLPRLVEATNNISPSGRKFEISAEAERIIMDSPHRAARFFCSEEARILKNELDSQVSRFKNEILIASMIENVNVRGRIIEYLIAGENEELRQSLIASLQGRTGSAGIPTFKTNNSLGDHSRRFADYHTETDVKTKMMILSSNPKAYNLDKVLEFLSAEKSVFLFYFVGVDATRIVNTVLVSMFQTNLLDSTILLKHWAGRNSRGVSQLEGRTIEKLILEPCMNIELEKSKNFLRTIIDL